MATDMPYLAIRSTEPLTATHGDATHGDVIHHFDVSCNKCRDIYGVWGPGPELDQQVREVQQHWLTEHLQTVCPFPRDFFFDVTYGAGLGI
jgi:hypothetical protein